MKRAILFRQIDDCLLLKSSDPHFKRNYRIFHLYFAAGLSTKEISEIPGIGLSVKGVESALMAMVSGLKTSLECTETERKIEGKTKSNAKSKAEDTAKF